jgi:hypothetical protein
VYPSDLTPEIQRALRALADIEARFEADQEGLEHWSGPSPAKQRLLAQLKARHGREREPLVQRLADLQREMTSAMIYAGMRPH